jgi:hypothetical protein
MLLKMLAVLVLALAATQPTPKSAPPNQPAASTPRAQEPDFQAGEKAKVMTVDRIDSLLVSKPGSDQPVRVYLAGIAEAPADVSKSFYAAEGLAHLRGLAQGEEVILVDDGITPKGERQVQAARASDKRWINRELVSLGSSDVSASFVDSKFAYQFILAKAEARKAQLGRHDQRAEAAFAAARGGGSDASTRRAVEAKKDQAKAEFTVYVTKSGTKYHRSGCSYLRSGGSPVSLKDAKSRYGPCSRCRPPTEEP